MSSASNDSGSGSDSGSGAGQGAGGHGAGGSGDGVTSLLWFRKGLRLHDNRALLAAVDGASHMNAVFVLDPRFASPSRVGVNRYRFLLESLQDLHTSLERRGSRLFVVQGNPTDVLPRVVADWGVSRVCFEKDSEPYAAVRDKQIQDTLEKRGVRVCAEPGHTLHDLEEYPRKFEGGKPPQTYGKFRDLLASMPPPAKPLDAPESLPPPSSAAVDASASGGSDAASTMTVPSLGELGYDPPPEGHAALFPGGESHALARMNEAMKNKDWVAGFKKPETDPTSLEPSTTALSPYLKFGCLSPRTFWHELARVYRSAKSHSKPPESLQGQLMWREFNYLLGANTPNWDKMVGNPACRQIPWDDDDEFFAAWRDARTGYPFIDAIQTQLRTEGWMHHLARHATACFLTRGDLWQSWEKGQRVFEHWLIDADWSINAFNWMWLSCSGFFYQYFRCYSPVAFGKKRDPDGKFIRKYLPVLRDMPNKYIYEPWKAPKGVQEKAGCIIGRDYPEPIVNHQEVSKANMSKMSAAYKNQQAMTKQLKDVVVTVELGGQGGNWAGEAVGAGSGAGAGAGAGGSSSPATSRSRFSVFGDEEAGKPPGTKEKHSPARHTSRKAKPSKDSTPRADAESEDDHDASSQEDGDDSDSDFEASGPDSPGPASGDGGACDSDGDDDGDGDDDEGKPAASTRASTRSSRARKRRRTT